MGYKMVALDIDGTIRSNDYPLSERTLAGLARVAEAGAVVTVATGRMFQSALSSTAGLNLTSPIVSFQGAHVADPITGEVLWHRPLTPEMARSALDALASWDMEILAYHGDRVYSSEVTPWLEAYGQRNQVDVDAAGDLKDFAANELTRLVVVGGEDEIRRLEAELKAKLGSSLYITRSLPRFCEILNPDSGKDKALAWLGQRIGITRDETVAFGNGYNDVQMLEWAGLGVAIGGAVPEVLEVADRVAPPVEEDGAAQVLEDLLNAGLIG